MNKIILGKTIQDKSLDIDLNETPYLLIASTPGHGMTNLIDNLICQFESKEYEVKVIKNLKEHEILEIFKEIKIVMETRYKVMRNLNVSGFNEYNLKMNKSDSLRRIFIGVDYLRELFDESFGYVYDSEVILSEFEKILKMAYQAGVNIISGVQGWDYTMSRILKYASATVYNLEIGDTRHGMSLMKNKNVKNIKGRYLLNNKNKVDEFQSFDKDHNELD